MKGAYNLCFPVVSRKEGAGFHTHCSSSSSLCARCSLDEYLYRKMLTAWDTAIAREGDGGLSRYSHQLFEGSQHRQQGERRRVDYARVR